MITEIHNFIESSREEFQKLVIQNQKLKNSFNIIISKDMRLKKSFFYINEDRNNPDIKEFKIRERDFYLNYIDMNKTFNKKIHSVSPYGLFYKQDTPDNLISDILSNEHYFKKIESFQDSKDIQKIKKYSRENLISTVLLELKDLKDEFQKWKESKLEKCREEFTSKVEVNEKVESLFDEVQYEIKVDEKKLKGCQSKIEKIEIEYIRVYFDFPIEDLKSFRKELFSKQLFNNSADYEKKNLISTQNSYSCPISGRDRTLGIPNFLNSLGDKKPFLIHKTRKGKFGGYPALHSQDVLENIYLFEQLLKSKTLPNPLPLFIQKDHIESELDLIRRGGQISFQEIFREVSEKLNFEDTLNYYLIFWKNSTSGLILYDVDYVENFHYRLELQFQNILKQNLKMSWRVENIFQLPHLFAELMGLKKINFFSDKFSSPIEREVTNLLFDYVYKAKTEVITENRFRDIALFYIREAIKSNEDFKKDFEIIKRFNIYLHLNSLFKGENLASKVTEYQNSLRKLFDLKEKNSLENDEEFAYASGQLIWFIIDKNQSMSKSHSLLEAFISKQSQKQFLEVIATNLRKYSHSMDIYQKEVPENSGIYKAQKGRVEKLASEVFAYKLDGSFKELIPIIMSGYFGDSLILEKKDKSKDGEKNGK